MTAIYTASIMTGGDLHHLGEQAVRDGVAWLSAHGFGDCVFQVELDLIDCPLVRVWWLTPDEVMAITDADLRATEGDIIPFCRVDEVAQRQPQPDWWQPA